VGEAMAQEARAALQASGWSAAEADGRLRALGWDALLPLLEGRLSAEAVAADVRRHTRCTICGHPLHQETAALRLSARGRERLLRGIPHTAACSCGYARPLVPEVWAVLLDDYFLAHPDADAADADEVLAFAQGRGDGGA
jgi:hypothetical protein